MKQTNSTSIIYTPRPDATPETEAAALATVYKLVLNAADAHKSVTGADDAERRSYETYAKDTTPK